MGPENQDISKQSEYQTAVRSCSAEGPFRKATPSTWTILTLRTGSQYLRPQGGTSHFCTMKTNLWFASKELVSSGQAYKQESPCYSALESKSQKMNCNGQQPICLKGVKSPGQWVLQSWTGLLLYWDFSLCGEQETPSLFGRSHMV